jgi:hypothetical protein
MFIYHLRIPRVPISKLWIGGKRVFVIGKTTNNNILYTFSGFCCPKHPILKNVCWEMERSEDFEKLNKNGGHKTSKNLKALFVNAFWKASFFFFL